jgi:hypothetical protein
MTTPKTHLIRWLQFLGKVQFKTVQLLGGGLTPGRVSFAPAGRRTKFHGVSAFSSPNRPAEPDCTVFPILFIEPRSPRSVDMTRKLPRCASSVMADFPISDSNLHARCPARGGNSFTGQTEPDITPPGKTSHKIVILSGNFLQPGGWLAFPAERGPQPPNRDTPEPNDDHPARGPFYTVQSWLTECALSGTTKIQLVHPIPPTRLIEPAGRSYRCVARQSY